SGTTGLETSRGHQLFLRNRAHLGTSARVRQDTNRSRARIVRARAPRNVSTWPTRGKCRPLERRRAPRLGSFPGSDRGRRSPRGHSRPRSASLARGCADLRARRTVAAVRRRGPFWRRCDPPVYFPGMAEGGSLRSLLGEGAGAVHANLRPARLVEMALARGEGMLADNGALVVRTGAKTGRSADDKYVVRTAETEQDVWWGNVNHPVSREVFDGLLARAVDHLRGGERFVFDGFAGAAPAHRLPLRVVTNKAWVSLFARTLFLRPTEAELATHAPGFTVV